MNTEPCAEVLVGQALRDKGLLLGTAESCTGGLVARRLSGVPGASTYFEGGVVAYSNRIKECVLGVPTQLLEAHGAVSEAVARSMAVGCQELLKVDVAVSLTGIAGPDGGSAEKPVGLVYIAVAIGAICKVTENHFVGSREEITAAAADRALELILEIIG